MVLRNIQNVTFFACKRRRLFPGCVRVGYIPFTSEHPTNLTRYQAANGDLDSLGDS